MNKAQRSRYFSILWPAACRAQGWPLKDECKRREVTLQATGSESTTGLDEHEITALFALLGHLAGDTTASDRWHRIERVGARAVNYQRQGEHHRSRAGYRDGGRVDMDRFRKLGDDEVAPEMAEAEAKKYLLTMRSRRNSKKQKAALAAVVEEVEMEAERDPF